MVVMIHCGMRATLISICLLFATAASADRVGVVGLYAAKRGVVRTTACADSAGRVTLYPGSLRDSAPVTPASYSLCIESERGFDELRRAFDETGFESGFGALTR